MFRVGILLATSRASAGTTSGWSVSGNSNLTAAGDRRRERPFPVGAFDQMNVDLRILAGRQEDQPRPWQHLLDRGVVKLDPRLLGGGPPLPQQRLETLG